MRKITLFILLFATANVLFCQTEKSNYKEISAKFEAFYNAEMYDSIFNLFAQVMKEVLPLEKTKGFFSELINENGKITKREFIKYSSTYAIYKTTFLKTVLSVNISLDSDNKINGLYFKPYVPDNLPFIDRNTTKLSLPFEGRWTVVWGGDTKELNYHVESQAQKNAFDFLVKDDNGKTFRSDGTSNEDYYAYGRNIIAPCNGEIALVVDGVKDNNPGDFNPVYIPGNTIIIRTRRNEFLLFAHFKHQSIMVKEGDFVRRGQLLGLCGNSGNSSEPHLHFHIQNVEDMNIATGVKCYFDNILVNGVNRKDYSPIQGNIIENDLKK
jgi:murein DD-endopeptidase MepM/ murein hydrolase activator NlpD